MKRLIYLATAAVAAMMVMVPTALAQDLLPGDDDPMTPEPDAVALSSHEELTGDRWTDGDPASCCLAACELGCPSLRYP